MNAFNEFKREDGYEVLSEEHPDSLHLVANCYSDASVATFAANDGSNIPVQMTAGSTQGDVYGGLLFCAAFSKALRSTQAKFKDKGLYMYAYYDDVYMVAPPRYMAQISNYFAAELRKINLQLRPSASAIYLPGSTTLPATLLPDIPDRSNRGIVVCGAPVGKDEFIKEELQKVTDKHNKLHERTREMDDAQCQYILLKFCT